MLKSPPETTMLDAVYRKCSHLNLRRFEECHTLIRWLAAAAGERILDVGCGDGFWDHQIARSGAHVVGIDVNDRALATAQLRNLTNRTEFHRMDAEQISFADASFDKAVSFCVIEHFSDDDAVLGHVARVLKPGGLLVLSADSLSNAEVTDAERDAHRRRYAVNTFYTLDVLRAKLDRVGIEIIEHRYILTTPLTLALVRATWRIDDMPPRFARLGDLAMVLFNTAGKWASAASERLARRENAGLTLLVRARKRS